MSYRPDWTRQAKNDYATAVKTGYGAKIAIILNTVRENPFEKTPGDHFEKLKGHAPPIYTRKINDVHRFVYTIEENTEHEKDPRTGKPYKGIVVIHRMWGHFPPK